MHSVLKILFISNSKLPKCCQWLSAAWLAGFMTSNLIILTINHRIIIKLQRMQRALCVFGTKSSLNNAQMLVVANNRIFIRVYGKKIRLISLETAMYHQPSKSSVFFFQKNAFKFIYHFNITHPTVSSILFQVDNIWPFINYYLHS